MAIVRKSLSEALASRPTFDRAMVEATSEAEIRQHMVEDGQDPDEATPAFCAVPNPQEIRKSLAMTQEAFAKALRVPVATIRNWEQGRTPPDPAARSLLSIVAHDPSTALKALAKT